MNKWTRANFQPNLPLRADGRRVTGSPEHIRISKDAAKEGMVLLKNDHHTLPLQGGARIALFGKGTVDYVKGGGGSAEVGVPYVRSLGDAFRSLALETANDGAPAAAYVSANVSSGALGGSLAGNIGSGAASAVCSPNASMIAPQLFEDSIAFYEKNVHDQYAAGALPGLTVEPEIPEEMLKKAACFTDTAIITISRFSGEGWDRKSEFDEGRDIIGVEDKDLLDKASAVYPKGDFYLTAEEEKMVADVTDTFDQVIVVLNVGGVVDTSWFARNDKIQAVLMAWQAGMEGGLAAAELLMGIGTPSGHLSDTFAEKLSDYPSADTFHESHVYADYFEDIYVGYRYFETIPGAKDKVVYPFGYGLSYTKFAIMDMMIWTNIDEAMSTAELTEFIASGKAKVTVHATVTNVGRYPGRETVQVYYGAPQGKLGKPARELAGYQKTRVLSPGESENVIITFAVKDMASYDDSGKVADAAYVLERGMYRFFVGNNVRDVEEISMTDEDDWAMGDMPEFGDSVLVLEQDLVIEQLQHRLVPKALKKRMKSDGSFEELEVNPLDAKIEIAEEIRNLANEQPTVFPRQAVKDMCPPVPAIRGMDGLQHWGPKDKPQLIDVAEGRMSLDDFIKEMSDEDLAWMLGGQMNTGVANTFGYGGNPRFGVPSIMTADGPAGIRLYEGTGIRTTAFPCATLLSCTWDPAVTELVGQAIAEEVKENNISVWLAPGVCIHRNPLCGRNFEYYSEDPLLTAQQAGGVVRGAQKMRIAATVKHFAFNNKETNRKNSDSRVSERAAREIYLKAFERIVNEAKPWSIMSSYNLVNGKRCSENKDLLTHILREEWGFDGAVCSDWWGYGEQYLECIAGNDIKMGRGWADRMLEAVKAGALTREDMETAVKHVLGLILKVD